MSFQSCSSCLNCRLHSKIVVYKSNRNIWEMCGTATSKIDKGTMLYIFTKVKDKKFNVSQWDLGMCLPSSC